MPVSDEWEALKVDRVIPPGATCVGCGVMFPLALDSDERTQARRMVEQFARVNNVQPIGRPTIEHIDSDDGLPPMLKVKFDAVGLPAVTSG